MLRTKLLIAAAVVSSALFSGGASAFVGSLPEAAVKASSIVEPVTFWAHPYPYGYAWHRPPPPLPCIQYRWVDTLFGPRLERFYVCGAPLRSRY